MDACFPHNYPHLHMPCLFRVADLHWSRGCHDEAENWDVGSRGASGTGQNLGGTAGALLMEDTYIGRTSEEVLLSVGGQTATKDDPVCVKSP